MGLCGCGPSRLRAFLLCPPGVAKAINPGVRPKAEGQSPLARKKLRQADSGGSLVTVLMRQPTGFVKQKGEAMRGSEVMANRGSVFVSLDRIAEPYHSPNSPRPLGRRGAGPRTRLAAEGKGGQRRTRARGQAARHPGIPSPGRLRHLLGPLGRFEDRPFPGEAVITDGGEMVEVEIVRSRHLQFGLHP